MRILHLLKHSLENNGHVHVAVDLACVQAAAGHDVVVASAGGRYDALLAGHGVEVVLVPPTEGVRDTLHITGALIRLVRRFRPDVIHAHMMSSAVVGFALSRIVRRPLVTTMHNSFDRHSFLMRLGTVVVAVSDAERRLLLSRGYPASKVVTVLNGATGSPRETIDAPELPPLRRPCLVTLSGLHARKAVDDVIRAFGEVLPDFPEWHLNIIGEGPDRERLTSMVEDGNLDHAVHLVGSTPRPQPLLEQAEIFAHASLAEPFGLAVAEARAAHCAVVATDVGGVPELLEQGRAGQLVPVSDPPAMAAVLRGLMADASTLLDWQDRAAHGAERFSVERMAQDYLTVYDNLAGGRTHRPRAKRTSLNVRRRTFTSSQSDQFSM